MAVSQFGSYASASSIYSHSVISDAASPLEKRENFAIAIRKSKKVKLIESKRHARELNTRVAIKRTELDELKDKQAVLDA